MLKMNSEMTTESKLFSMIWSCIKDDLYAELGSN